MTFYSFDIKEILVHNILGKIRVVRRLIDIR
nr:MAG TPA: hypothetical protein [Caudoviricetes sp.]